MKKYRYDKEIISAKEWVQNTLNIKFQHNDPISDLNSFLVNAHSLDAVGSAVRLICICWVFGTFKTRFV